MKAQDHSDSRPDREQVVAAIRQARRGDAAAFRWLRDQFHLPLVGIVAEKTGWEHHHARQAADTVWDKERACLLRLPQEGGYGADGRGSFPYYIWNHCIPWAGTFERNTRASEDPGPGGLIVHPVKIGRTRHPELPLVDGEGRPRDVPVEQDFEPDDGSGRDPKERARCEAMFVLLEVVFLPAIGYPHQQLAFGFSKLIYGRRSKGGGMYGDPTQTVAKHASAELSSLAGEFARAYDELVALTPADHARIQTALQPLRARLLATVAEMVQGDRESEQQCAAFAERLVGKTRLEDYFAAWNGDGVKAVTNWSNRVKERVMRWLRAEGQGPDGGEGRR